eukprot:TRINITY_DN65984_c0_g1_i1.p1 TRINITY_DN65984_c0_g1~~TRINITY_DN65984_c0_g1_i1.p1  ORF type:complete len:661 (+),score=98.18 TRINITY_DN65984_c0_g1_i1:69-1985(+)
MDASSVVTDWLEGSVVELHGLKARPELNGVKATVLKSLPENIERGRVRLQLMHGDAIELSIKPSNLRLIHDSLCEAFSGEGDEFEESEEEDEEDDLYGDSDEEMDARALGRSSKPKDGWCQGIFNKVQQGAAPKKAKSDTTNESPSTEACAGVKVSKTSEASQSEEKTLWCYGCFKECPSPTRSLQRCSKCGVAVFCSRECQRQVFPFHKLSCGVPEKEKVSALRGDRVLAALQREFGGAGPSPHTALLLARIRELLILRYEGGRKEKKLLGVDPDDVGMELHTMARVFFPSEAHCVQYYSMFWAAPGMPEFLLGTPLVTGVKQVPNEYTGKDKFGISLEDRASMSVDDDIFSTPTLAGYQYAFFHFNFLVRSITKEASSGPSICSVNSGQSALRRELPCFQAAARRLGVLYVTSCETCGDSLASGPGAMLMLCAGEPSLRREFLAIGLGRAALHEAQTAASKRTAKKLLKSIPSSDWHALPVEQAALLSSDLAHSLLERHWGDSDDEDDATDNLSTIAREVLNTLFRRQSLEGVVPTRAADVIMEAALKLGRRSDLTTRAFWHFVKHEWLAGAAVFDAGKATAAWKKRSDDRFLFFSKGGADSSEKTANRKAYLHHLEAAMIDDAEREEWTFMFKDE